MKNTIYVYIIYRYLKIYCIYSFLDIQHHKTSSYHFHFEAAKPLWGLLNHQLSVPCQGTLQGTEPIIGPAMCGVSLSMLVEMKVSQRHKAH